MELQIQSPNANSIENIEVKEEERYRIREFQLINRQFENALSD